MTILKPFTIREAAEYLEVAKITVRRWVKEGALKSRRIGRNIVFNPADLRGCKHKQRRGRVSRFLKSKPLGGMNAWTELHKERTEADDSRG